MIIVDTNVLSAMMASQFVPEVRAWVSAQPPHSLFTCTICQAEILAGIAAMPPGRRQIGLASAARLMFAEDFEGRIMPFDAAAAQSYAEIYAKRRRAGFATSSSNLFIAAIAHAHGGAVATRDMNGFAESGVDIMNPWQP